MATRNPSAQNCWNLRWNGLCSWLRVLICYILLLAIDSIEATWWHDGELLLLDSPLRAGFTPLSHLPLAFVAPQVPQDSCEDHVNGLVTFSHIFHQCYMFLIEAGFYTMLLFLCHTPRLRQQMLLKVKDRFERSSAVTAWIVNPFRWALNCWGTEDVAIEASAFDARIDRPRL